MPMNGTLRNGHALISAGLMALSLAACAPTPPRPSEPARLEQGAGAQEAGNPLALDLATVSDLAHILPDLAGKRVVYVGERHDRYGDHLNQLAVIRGLYARHPSLAIGVEYIQQPFQPYLDAYIAGRIDEKTFLRSVEYYSRWRFDYRLYRPIFRFARERHIPMVALNVPREITDQVSAKGIAGVRGQDKAGLPGSISRSDAGYRQHLESVYERHPHRPDSHFENFYEVQLVWDEGMAERAARYLRAHPDSPMVILAGAGHVAHGSGIPKRLERRIDVDSAIVLNGLDNGIDPTLGDYLLTVPDQTLPPPGRLGIYMEERDNAVFVSGFAQDSAAQAAGLQEGDRIIAVAGAPVHSAADVKIALLDGRPGDVVSVTVRRAGQAVDRTYRIEMR